MFGPQFFHGNSSCFLANRDAAAQARRWEGPGAAAGALPGHLSPPHKSHEAQGWLELCREGRVSQGILGRELLAEIRSPETDQKLTEKQQDRRKENNLSMCCVAATRLKGLFCHSLP